VSRVLPVFAVVFAVVYALIYTLAVWKNYALFTYHPALNEFGIGVQKPKDGPAMYWYGWMATSGIVALVARLIACSMPTRIKQRLWSGWSWTIPLGVIFVFGYLLKGFFTR